MRNTGGQEKGGREFTRRGSSRWGKRNPLFDLSPVRKGDRRATAMGKKNSARHQRGERQEVRVFMGGGSFHLTKKKTSWERERICGVWVGRTGGKLPERKKVNANSPGFFRNLGVSALGQRKRSAFYRGPRKEGRMPLYSGWEEGEKKKGEVPHCLY